MLYLCTNTTSTARIIQIHNSNVAHTSCGVCGDSIAVCRRMCVCCRKVIRGILLGENVLYFYSTFFTLRIFISSAPDEYSDWYDRHGQNVYHDIFFVSTEKRFERHVFFMVKYVSALEFVPYVFVLYFHFFFFHFWIISFILLLLLITHCHVTRFADSHIL